MTIQTGSGTKWWFNGLPFQTTVQKSGTTLGTQKYWIDGLPLVPYVVAAPSGFFAGSFV